jgi:hypothetical protein
MRTASVAAMPLRAAELTAHLPSLCTVAEAAAVFRTTPRNIKRWLAAGRLTGIRVVPGEGSSRVLIPRRSLEHLLALALGERS